VFDGRDSDEEVKGSDGSGFEGAGDFPNSVVLGDLKDVEYAFDTAL